MKCKVCGDREAKFYGLLCGLCKEDRDNEIKKNVFSSCDCCPGISRETCKHIRMTANKCPMFKGISW